ncbi:MAG: lysostaphin resistance A-like protein [Lachnospiraceae bacterium]
MDSYEQQESSDTNAVNNPDVMEENVKGMEDHPDTMEGNVNITEGNADIVGDELETMGITSNMMDPNVTMTKKEMRKAGAFFLIILLLQLPLSFVFSFFSKYIPEDSYYLASVLITQGYLLVSAIVYLLITKKKFTLDLQLKKYKLSSFFLSLVVLMTAAPMASVFNIISQFFAKNRTSATIFEISEKLPVWLGIIVVGCLPGFIEETIYRGIMYQAFRRRSILTGIIVSAVSFGLMHLNFNQILYAIYLGVILALLVEATGSLGSSMILHMVFNGVNTAYVYILPKILQYMTTISKEAADLYLDVNGEVNMLGIMSETPTKLQLMSTLIMYLPMAMIGLVLTILLLRKIAKINGRDLSLSHMLGDIRLKAVVPPVTVCLVLGWIFCLINAVIELFI